MKKGDKVEATWTDGLVITGTYSGSERGYLILKDGNGKIVACNPASVTLRVLTPFVEEKIKSSKDEYCECCECDPCDCDWGNC